MPREMAPKRMRLVRSFGPMFSRQTSAGASTLASLVVSSSRRHHFSPSASRTCGPVMFVFQTLVPKSKRADAARLIVVMDRCPKIEVPRLGLLR